MEIAMERAVMDKKPVPEIDFTLHTMEDGAQVSTQERVCKGKFTLSQLRSKMLISCRCTSARDVSTLG